MGWLLYIQNLPVSGVDFTPKWPRTTKVPSRNYWKCIIKNQMGNRTLNSEAGNGNWWQPCNHERKLLIGQEHTFPSPIQPSTPCTLSTACLTPVQSSAIQYSLVQSSTTQCSSAQLRSAFTAQYSWKISSQSWKIPASLESFQPVWNVFIRSKVHKKSQKADRKGGGGKRIRSAWL